MTSSDEKPVGSGRQKLTPLEMAILEKFWMRYRSKGFPSPEKFHITFALENPAGRSLTLSHDGLVDLPDGELKIGDQHWLELPTLEHGAGFEVFVGDGKVDFLQIYVNGLAEWDGNEDYWVITE